jgi:hypothetical protein
MTSGGLTISTLVVQALHGRRLFRMMILIRVSITPRRRMPTQQLRVQTEGPARATTIMVVIHRSVTSNVEWEEAVAEGGVAEEDMTEENFDGIRAEETEGRGVAGIVVAVDSMKTKTKRGEQDNLMRPATLRRLDHFPLPPSL